MGISKKRGIILIIVLAAVLTATLAVKLSAPERAVLRAVKANEAALNQMVEAYLAGDTDALKTNIPGVRDVDYWYGDHAMIEFFVTGRGIVPASSYYGFYYSVDGVPLAFQNAKMTLTPSGDGWEWKEGGDNRGYTEHITGNWYYYEASF